MAPTGAGEGLAKQAQEVSGDGNVSVQAEPFAQELDGGSRRSKGRPDRSPRATADTFDKIESLMRSRDMKRAEVMLNQLLEKSPKDDRAMHYLGVLLTEECRYEEAEVQFHHAFDAQEKAGKINYATAFGLATVLTEIGGTEKLLQGEALFRDFLARAIEQDEGGIHETYSAFVNLADNFERQKRWSESAEALVSAVKLAERMFGEDHERTVKHRADLERAERLSKYQWWIRRVLWTVSIVTVIWAIWTFAHSRLPRALMNHLSALISPSSTINEVADPIQMAGKASAFVSGEL